MRHALAVGFCCLWVGGLSAAPFVPPRDAHCVAFSPDGRTLAVGISGQSNSEFPPRPHPSPRKCGVIQLFDLASKKRLRRIETYGDLTEIAFSPDGAWLAAARLYVTEDGIEMNEVRVWEAATGRVRHTLDRCHAFAFDPQRAEIAVASHKRCVVFDLTTGERRQQAPPLADALRLAFPPAGQALCGIVQVPTGFVLRICDRETGAMRAESSPLADPFYSLALPRDGTRLATGHAGGVVLLWDLVDLQPVGKLTTGTSGRAFPFFSPSGELLGAADQSNSDVVIWDLAAGRELTRYTFRQGALHTYLTKSPERRVRPEEDPSRFAFAPDGESFAGGPFGGIVRLVADGRDTARFGE